MNTTQWLFAADLHGQRDRYRKLFARAAAERPAAILLGGDLLPGGSWAAGGSIAPHDDFVGEFLAPELAALRAATAPDPPRVCLIFGNDDPRCEETGALALAGRGLLEYAHGRRLTLGEWRLYGYACVPPTPFLLKDWERYDVSRYVDPGCVSPEEGLTTVPRNAAEVKWGSIAADLAALAPAGEDLSRAIFLFHSPPHETALDRADLDGRTFEHVPLDPHVGSLAIRRFIEQRQPLVTLHGHVHESARLTGTWRERLGATHCFSAAHDGPELALVRFTPEDPARATRELV